MKDDSIQYCCEQLKVFSSDNETDIIYNKKFREFGILISDGGSSFQMINYCPWCGMKLPTSLRDQWFDEIWALGLEPDGDNLPGEYLSDLWWKAKNL